ncbi:hypothetical protein ANN_26644 [Periplaneta americana]|uniref:Uncharacterized protein n=1 Tax=Periplaneta americana TaxID=6978 RepID=A0ABQ8RYY4_PERAM|nr:hypothetical protein ANN_26644 [Periplaneta americana]
MIGSSTVHSQSAVPTSSTSTSQPSTVQPDSAEDDGDEEIIFVFPYNDAETDQKEEKELAESLAEKELPTEGRTETGKEFGAEEEYILFEFMEISTPKRRILPTESAKRKKTVSVKYTIRKKNGTLLPVCAATFQAVSVPVSKQKFKDIIPGISLPPQPILTLGGTWLKAALYYCEHYKEVRGVIQTFDDEASTSIKVAKSLFSEPFHEDLL